MTPMHREDVFDDLRESHAAVAVASNDFHRRGVIGGPQRENPGEANGSRHGEMPPDRTGHPHRFDYGSQELRGHAGIFRAGPLPDLSDRARMVCQGGLGLRRRAAPAARATQGGPLSLLPAALAIAAPLRLTSSGETTPSR